MAHAAQKFGTMFGVSSLGTVSLEEISSNFSFPQVYQFYFHKDRGLNNAMLERAKSAGVRVMMLTVETRSPAVTANVTSHRIFDTSSADTKGDDLICH